MARWRRWHTRRSAAFDALPVTARGLFAELLVAVKDDGWIEIGTERKDLWRLIGAHPRERRALSRCLDLLIANGTVEEHPQGWLIPGLQRYQYQSTGDALGVHQACIGRALGASSVEPKPPESQESFSLNRTEQNRTEPLREIKVDHLRAAWVRVRRGVGLSTAETDHSVWDPHWERVLRRIQGQASVEGVADRVVARRLFDGFAAHQWARDRGYLAKQILGGFDRYVSKGASDAKRERARERDDSDLEARLEAMEREAVGVPEFVRDLALTLSRRGATKGPDGS